MVEKPKDSFDELNQITEKIIHCAFLVSNSLGIGFMEKVYENSMVIELRDFELSVQQQAPILVNYKNNLVGEYNADLLVENSILVELKAVKTLDDNHFAQCMNYLKATGFKICLLLNFGTKSVQIKRIIN
jgi:GxxExxY protein